jgi:hypothetical protein
MLVIDFKDKSMSYQRFIFDVNNLNRKMVEIGADKRSTDVN